MSRLNMVRLCAYVFCVVVGKSVDTTLQDNKLVFKGCLLKEDVLLAVFLDKSFCITKGKMQQILACPSEVDRRE